MYDAPDVKFHAIDKLDGTAAVGGATVVNEPLATHPAGVSAHVTSVGSTRCVVVPSPICPNVLCPQQNTEKSDFKEHVCRMPEAISLD